MDQEDQTGFEKFLDAEKQLGKRTISLYMSYYKHFEPLKLSQEYIHEFILKHKNNPVVRSFVVNYLAYHDIQNITLPQTPKGSKNIKKAIRPISSSDINKIREHLYKKDFIEGLVFDMIYQGALRRAEIPTIKIGWFRWSEWLEDTTKFCRLLVLGKGNKERFVLINPETAEALLNKHIEKYHLDSMQEINGFIEDHKESLLFSKKNGEALTEKNVYDIIKTGSLQILKRDVRPHELRHERANELEKKGVSILDIKNYLGHTRIATTEIYLHKSGEESLNKIEELS